MAKHFEVLGTMASRNLDIRQSMNFVEGKTVKAGGQITMGVDNKTLTDLAFHPEKFHVMLIVADAEQYEQINKELDSAGKKEKCG